MDKSDNKYRCKHASGHPNTFINKYRNDGEEKTEYWRKHHQQQGRDLSMGHDRSDRRHHSNPPNDINSAYHCSTDSYRSRKHHGASSASRTKYLVPPTETYRVDAKNNSIVKASRSPYYPSNVAVVRKQRYKDDIEDDEESKYVNEPGDENVGDETTEEIVDEENDNIYEYSDKDYEEQEADDEVDEESDVLEQVDKVRSIDRGQRKNRTETLIRGQRNFSTESTNPHRGLKIVSGKELERCCHNADNVDVITEEEDENDGCDVYPSKNSPWRYKLSHPDREGRNEGRHFGDKYLNFNRTSTGSGHQNRRSRTTNPDIESSLTSTTRFTRDSILNNRCSNCGISTSQTPKTTSSRNASYRLQDSRFFNRGPIGDEGEIFDDEPIISYSTKARRSKDSRSPIYDPREESRKIDAELGAIYKTCRTKNPRELSSGERTRNSVRVSNNRLEVPTSSKTGNRNWRCKN